MEWRKVRSELASADIAAVIGFLDTRRYGAEFPDVNQKRASCDSGVVLGIIHMDRQS